MTADAAESGDDVLEEIEGHPQDGRQHVYVCLCVGIITSAMKKSP
jgi:hypothetical protein